MLHEIVLHLILGSMISRGVNEKMIERERDAGHRKTVHGVDWEPLEVDKRDNDKKATKPRERGGRCHEMVTGS